MSAIDYEFDTGSADDILPEGRVGTGDLENVRPLPRSLAPDQATGSSGQGIGTAVRQRSNHRRKTCAT